MEMRLCAFSTKRNRTEKRKTGTQSDNLKGIFQSAVATPLLKVIRIDAYTHFRVYVYE